MIQKYLEQKHPFEYNGGQSQEYLNMIVLIEDRIQPAKHTEKTETMAEKTTTMTSIRDSSELPFIIHPIAYLVVNVTSPMEVE